MKPEGLRKTLLRNTASFHQLDKKVLQLSRGEQNKPAAQGEREYLHREK